MRKETFERNIIQNMVRIEYGSEYFRVSTAYYGQRARYNKTIPIVAYATGMAGRRVESRRI